MKNTAWLPLVMISLTLAACAQQTNGLLSLEGLGIRIAIDEDDKPPTEEALFRRKMLDALPYHAALPMHRHSALGQLSKVSDYIAVGKVVSVMPITNSYWGNASITLKLEDVLLGVLPSKEITVTGGWPDEADYKVHQKSGGPFLWNWKLRPKRGDRMLVYLLDRTSVKQHWDTRGFHFSKGEIEKTGLLHFAWGNMGVRYLDTPENTTNYLNAARAYIRELRDGKRDEESYYSLLRTLVRSPVQSVREDARSDLMFFIEFCPSFDARRVLADDNIDEAIKYWVEHDVLPGREQQKADAQNEP
ncbi:MAG: hypothetical protein GX174_08470 [Lentisphaerae bacterium]|jgi:hypothetical protein|nr:hypothetical protein [Lentisphaerota bacterium]